MDATPSRNSSVTSSTDATVMIDARYLNGRPSGIGRYTRQLIDHLLTLDDELRLRLITHPADPRPFEHRRVHCQTFHSAPNSPATRYLLSRRVDFEGVDLFHSPYNLLPRNLPVPAIFTLHDIMWLIDPAFCSNRFLKKMVSGFFNRLVIPPSVQEADALLTVSHHSRREIEDWFGPRAPDVAVSYNGVDPYFRPLPPHEAWPLLAPFMAPRTQFALIVGQGAPYKNHTAAVRAFLQAFGDDPQMYLVLVRRIYSGPDDELKQLLDDPRLNSRVILLDGVSLPQLRALYAMARLFLFPSLYEGFGLPALEAMACGTAVMASDRGAPDEVCGDAALKVDPTDVDAMAHAMARLHRDDALRRHHQQAGPPRARQFQWRSSAQSVLRTYRRVLQRGD